MTTSRRIAIALGFVLAFSVAANAAPVTFTLARTSVLYNEDPPGAPLPLGRTQRDAGDVIFNNQKIGEYLWVKDVHDGGLNTAAVTLTLFFANPGGAPYTITLQGSHDFTSGKGQGSISASAFAGLSGFTYSSTPTSVTLNLP